MKEGQWNEAIEELRATLDKEPSDPITLFNLGVCRLAVDDLDQARADFVRCNELRPGSTKYLVFSGAVSWWQSDSRNAVKQWEAALDAEYVDAAGGILAPAALYFVSQRTPDLFPQARSVELLREIWTTKLARNWPGAIGGLLLDEIDVDTFLFKQKFRNATLEERRLCRAWFWVGVKHYCDGRLDDYKKCLVASVRPADSPAVLCEVEHWLAKAELELLFHDSRKFAQ